MCLWEAMEEERWAASALDAMDGHLALRGDGKVELRTFQTFVTNFTSEWNRYMKCLGSKHKL